MKREYSKKRYSKKRKYSKKRYSKKRKYSKKRYNKQKGGEDGKEVFSPDESLAAFIKCHTEHPNDEDEEKRKDCIEAAQYIYDETPGRWT